MLVGGKKIWAVGRMYLIIPYIPQKAVAYPSSTRLVPRLIGANSVVDYFMTRNMPMLLKMLFFFMVSLLFFRIFSLNRYIVSFFLKGSRRSASLFFFMRHTCRAFSFSLHFRIHIHKKILIRCKEALLYYSNI